MTSSPSVQQQFQHVYWIGGGSAAGKSTIAHRIAAEQGLSVYATDELMADHARRSSREECPLLHKFMNMDTDERLVNRSPKTMLETFHWFQGEAFDFIIQDLLRLRLDDAGVIVEGFRLLPHLVKPLLAATGHAVWLLPTPDFRHAVVESRGGSAWGFLGRTSEPERALRNLLERDRMFTEILRQQTEQLGLHSIKVDSSITEDDLAKQVMRMFGF